MLSRSRSRRNALSPMALALIALFGVTLPFGHACETDEDCAGDKPKISQSGEWVFTDNDEVIARGYCRDARCICTAPYTGKNCQLLNRVQGPALEDTLRVKSWRFLAKTCWAGETEGSLRIKMEWKNVACGKDKICFPVPTPTWNESTTPSVYFYASFDPAFEDAVLASYQGELWDDKEVDRTHCSGSDSVLKRRFTCSQKSEGDTETCVYEDTFRVVNRAAQGTLVYVVVGGCELKGLVDWDVSVDVQGATRDDERGSACGSTLTTLSHRCFSEAGGSCEVQSSEMLTYSFQPANELSRSAIAGIAVAFVLVVFFGLVLIKVYQARVKKARAQRMLNRMGIANKDGGDTSEGDAYAGMGNTQQHFTINGVQSG